MQHISIYTGKTKAGKDFTALKVSVGVYTTLVFPSPAEMEYIKAKLTEMAHNDFQDGLEDEADV